MALVLDKYSDQVQALYIAYFGRAAEPDGFRYWERQLQSGAMTFSQAAASFAQQPEALAQHNFLKYPAFFTATDFVDSLYLQLLNREPDASGRAYWIEQLNQASGKPAAIGVLIAQFVSGASSLNGDAAIIQNKIDAGRIFTTELASEGIGGTTDGASLHPKYLSIARDVVDNEITSDPASIATSEAELDLFINPPPPPPVVVPPVTPPPDTGPTIFNVTPGAGIPISVLEGNQFSGSTLSFRIERSGDISQGASVDYLMSGHGTNPASANDLVGGFQSGTITFQPGQAYVLFGVIVNGDTDIEPDEQFTFTIFNPVNAVIDDDSEIATIRNDDPIPPQRLLVQSEPMPAEYLG